MSDYQHGTSEYILDIIDDKAEVAVTTLHEINESMKRSIDAMRELLNLENECATYCRSMMSDREKVRKEQVVQFITFTFYDVAKLLNITDDITEFFSLAPIPIMASLDVVFVRLHDMITNEITKRTKAESEIKRLLKEDQNRL